MASDSHRRVVVVDDDEAMRMLLAAALGAHGFDVLEAGSGQELLRLKSTEDLDLVVMDLRMPGMTGLDTVRALRASQRDDTAVILMTAFADPSVEADASRLGVPLLSKPFSLDALTKLASELLSRAPQAEK